MNIRKTFLNKVGTKTFYLVTLFALAAVAAAGFLLVPTNTNTVSAQDNVISARATRVPHEVLTSALDFRTATDFAVFADKGISDNGGSKIGGDIGVASEGAEIKGLNRSNVKGMLRSGAGAASTRTDFSSSFNYINQLPCTEVADSNLGGKTFTPGVYCLSSADLAGQVMLNAENDASGIFIFNITGSLTTQSGSGMLLMNEASASNVFFLTNDSAIVAENSDFRGSILARNNINVKSSTVAGRTLSLNGKVELENSTVALQVGFLQICKTATGFVDSTSQGSGGLGSGTDALTRVFTFRVGGQTFTAPVGGCTNRISTATGPTTIEELPTNTNLAGVDAVTGRFILTQVTSNVPGSINAVNLPLRTANVTVREGDLANQTVVTFNNQFAVVGFVEICKVLDDTGVGGATTGNSSATPTLPGGTGGIFEFRIDGVNAGDGTPARFFAPAGGCTGLIAVPVAISGFNAPLVRTSVDVMEIVPANTTFTGAFTIPSDRLIAVNTTNGIVTDAPTRGVPTTRPLGPTSVRAEIREGGTTTAAANQTTIFFRNRTEATLKVCKIAGPGVPQGTLFTFNVNGQNTPTNVAPTTIGNTPNAFPSGNPTGTAGTGTTIAGAFVDSSVTVPAGPAPNGFCVFVPTAANTTGNAAGQRTFTTGSRITVTETGVVGDPTTGATNNNFLNIGGVTGNVQVSRIRFLNDPTGATTSASTTAVLATAPDRTTIINNNARSISFIALPGVNEVEFVNFIFNPGLLKICKVAGAGVAVGEVFTFTVTTGTADGLLPATSRTVTVQAGPAATNEFAQNGFCSFAFGPFTEGGTTGAGGFFNLGSTVTVTETVPAGVVISSITSPTAGTGSTTAPVVAPGFTTSGNSGTFAGSIGFVSGINEVVFVNTRPGTVVTPTPTPGVSPTATPVGATPTPTPPVVVTPTTTPGPIIVPLRPRKKGGSRLMTSF